MPTVILTDVRAAFTAIPHGSVAARLESALRAKHSIYLDVVTVASALYPGCWRQLRPFALEAHDLALTKLERNFERDRGDVEHLARSGYPKASILQERYTEELRSYVIGRVSWHDQMWIEASLTETDPPGGPRG